jgi:arginyl-tRNA synthetase
MKIKNYLEACLQEAVLKNKFVSEPLLSIDISTCKQKEHGDLATNLAFILAKKTNRSPREIAESITKVLNVEEDYIEKVDVAGAGFINFTISRKYLYGVLQDILDRRERYGTADWGGGKETQVEFVSANPTGPLTIGHGRQAVLGDTIARLLEATGHRVTREYYYNDAGRQMRVLGNSVYLRYRELLGDSVDFPEDFYQGQYITDIARTMVERHGDTLKRSENVDLFQECAEETIFTDIKKTLARLDISFDVFYNEKSLYESGKVDRVIQELRDRGLAYDLDGAVWLRLTDFGHEQDRVIVKSSGEPTYRLPDIAYHKDKMDRGFELIVDIFGSDHVDTYPDVLAGLKILGYDPSRVKVLIHQFVTLMEGKEKIKMSTRKANFVTLDELMDEVGADVTRYFFQNRSMSSHLNFDLTLAKTQSDENPVFSVQYAYARICSILRHAHKEGFNPENSTGLEFSLLTAPEETALMKVLMVFPEVVRSAAKEFEPHRIPLYLEEVAATYHRYQHGGKKDEKLRVVTKDTSLTLARLGLCRAVQVVLGNGLALMGISRPEKM